MSVTAKVIVGDTICGGARENKITSDNDTLYLRGFNTYSGGNPSAATLSQEGGGQIVAAINGTVEITDRVVSVKGRFSRYLPEIGDVVVGRITEVAGSRWLVDVNAHQNAIMLLSNVTEPGGMLRRRNRGDELGMRQLFDQEDLIAAEVQRISPEGTISLHSRGTEKYGRLSGAGQFVQVRASLVKRAKHQFLTLTTVPVNLVLGMNGYIWVSGAKGKAVDNAERSNITRVANCIKVLGMHGIEVHQKTIEAVVETSFSMSLSLFDILMDENRSQLAANVSENTLKRARVDLF